MTDKPDIIRRNGHNIRFPAAHAVSDEAKKHLIRLAVLLVLNGKKREERDGLRDTR